MRALCKTTHWRQEMSDIENRVKKIVAEQLGVAEADIKTESSFVDDLGADSLDTVELVMALEDVFEMEIPDEQAEKITTVQQAIDYDKAHVKAWTRFDRLQDNRESAPRQRRVVITGLGCVSPSGKTVAESCQALIAGKSGIATISRFDASPFATRFAGEVKGFRIDDYIPAKEARH